MALTTGSRRVPRGTEDVYKLYAESFKGSDHLRRIEEEALAVIQNVFHEGQP
jgi:phosphoglucomutase